MRKLLAILLLLPVISLAQTAAPKKAAAKAKPAGPAPVVVTPDKIQWGPAPAVFPSGAQFAVLAGDPGKPGPFTVRIKAPDGYRIMPHWHPAAENVTVLSGEFHVGMGDKFDESSMLTLPTHSLAVVPPHHNHYAMTKGETELQVSSTGPFKLIYVNPADDPSKGQATPAAKKKTGAKKK
ncbi:MAG TPA: cupin domain-containing protein [Candidatus Dormibacteraeota bacterium]|nr:cupin domain-containing protein [Candidatus Dormibacteraeota bacterium]